MHSASLCLRMEPRQDGIQIHRRGNMFAHKSRAGWLSSPVMRSA